MNAVEFTTDLSGRVVLVIPEEMAADLPKAGKARGIVLTDAGTGNAEWRLVACEQSLRDGSSEDAVHESCHERVWRGFHRPGSLHFGNAEQGADGGAVKV